MRVTVNLDKETEKIFKEINKLRLYGWVSRDFREMLKAKYGTTKKILTELINENQQKIDKLYKENQELAKKINKK